MTNTTISPFVVGGIEQVELSDGKGGKKKYWRKQILPSGKRMYKGKELDFSTINPSVVKAFEEKAVDQVPLVLALANNKHPETGQEIEKLEGDLTKLEMSKEGSLYGYFDLTPKVVEKINASNKKLGVSARIDIGYKREDVGKEYPYALRHVCATTAGHIKGMDPWETVELSDEDKKGETFDFSTEVIEETTATKETGDDLVAVEIPKAQLDKLMAFIGDMEKGDEVARKLAGETETETETTQLSEEAQRRIELAETTAQEANRRIELAEAKAAVSEWNTLKRELALGGVPPVMLDLAEPVLKLHKRPVITLSDNETVDAADVLVKVLEAAKGTITLGEEKGHSVTDSDSTTGDKDFEAFATEILAGMDY